MRTAVNVPDSKAMDTSSGVSRMPESCGCGGASSDDVRIADGRSMDVVGHGGCAFGSMASGGVFKQARVVRPFSLISTNGAVIDNSTLNGKTTLIYFGYAKCQSRCPPVVATLVELLEHRAIDSVLFLPMDPSETDDELSAFAVQTGFVVARGDFRSLMVSLRAHSGAYGAGQHPGSVFYVNADGMWSGFCKEPVTAEKILLDLVRK